MRIGVITVSDGVHRGTREDKSGAAIKEYVEKAEGSVVDVRVVPDEIDLIERALLAMTDEQDLDVVFTTGGTGVAPRDVTPEATRRVIDREVPGIAEAMRAESLAKTRRAMLSRATAGTRGRSLIINLPGSTRGAIECLDAVFDQLPHAVALIRERPIDH